jgi:hypothetical protein
LLLPAALFHDFWTLGLVLALVVLMLVVGVGVV